MYIYEDIIKKLKSSKVKFMLVGGIAVNLLGSLRSTADMDILVEMSDKNLTNLFGLLRKEGYRIKQPIKPEQILNETTRGKLINEKNLKAINFYKNNTLSEVDVIIDSPVSFQQAIKNALFIKVGKISFPVISFDDLIRMKSVTGRYIDKLDIEALKNIKKLRGHR
jgi:hypothetical protein